MDWLIHLYEWGNRWIPSTAQVLADCLTIAIAGVTLFGVLRYRKKIPSLIRAVISQHLSERFNRVRETLQLIEDEKILKNSSRARNLFSRLNGQLLSICEIAPDLKSIQKVIEEIAERNGELNEGIKLRLVHQVEGLLENSKIKGLIDIAGEVGSGR